MWPGDDGFYDVNSNYYLSPLTYFRPKPMGWALVVHENGKRLSALDNEGRQLGLHKGEVIQAFGNPEEDNYDFLCV